VCGGPGIVEAIERRGAVAVHEPPFDAVLVGFHRTFDYEVMRQSSAAVRAGARLIATNSDATYPTPDGPIPGGGAILAAIATASGVAPIVAGKPFAPMASLAREITGVDDLAGALMVGDRPDTDGLFSQALSCRYAQVWSGVAQRGSVITPTPWLEADDLAAVAECVLR
jgi:ribonucleotide monophosphatase NagD (HAD superfamily)